MPYCIKCGTSNIDEAFFCFHCGAKIDLVGKPEKPVVLPDTVIEKNTGVEPKLKENLETPLGVAEMVTEPVVSGIKIGEPKSEMLDQSGVGSTWKCPYCSDMVKAKALVCSYCGRDLQVVEERDLVLEQKPEKSVDKWNLAEIRERMPIWLGVVLIGLVSYGLSKLGESMAVTLWLPELFVLWMPVTMYSLVWIIYSFILNQKKPIYWGLAGFINLLLRGIFFPGPSQFFGMYGVSVIHQTFIWLPFAVLFYISVKDLKKSLLYWVSFIMIYSLLSVISYVLFSSYNMIANPFLFDFLFPTLSAMVLYLLTRGKK
jgi:hypothetical protein